MNIHPDGPRESEGGIPSYNPPVVSGGSANLTADLDETHKNFSEDGGGEGLHPETRPGSIIYVAVKVILHQSKDSFDHSIELINEL